MIQVSGARLVTRSETSCNSQMILVPPPDHLQFHPRSPVVVVVRRGRPIRTMAVPPPNRTILSAMRTTTRDNWKRHEI